MGVESRLQRNLNCLFAIFKALILWSRVDGGIPSFAAAPDGPDTLPLLSTSAASIISRSLPGSILPSPLTSTGASIRDAGNEVSLESHISSTERTSPELNIMDLSITLCNSRMLPDHQYTCNSSCA